jgi:hypothetical protein
VEDVVRHHLRKQELTLQPPAAASHPPPGSPCGGCSQASPYRMTSQLRGCFYLFMTFLQNAKFRKGRFAFDNYRKIYLWLAYWALLPKWIPVVTQRPAQSALYLDFVTLVVRRSLILINSNRIAISCSSEVLLSSITE